VFCVLFCCVDLLLGHFAYLVACCLHCSSRPSDVEASGYTAHTESTSSDDNKFDNSRSTAHYSAAGTAGGVVWGGDKWSDGDSLPPNSLVKEVCSPLAPVITTTNAAITTAAITTTGDGGGVREGDKPVWSRPQTAVAPAMNPEETRENEVRALSSGFSDDLQEFLAMPSTTVHTPTTTTTTTPLPTRDGTVASRRSFSIDDDA
jgi:hypothetical protein